MAPMLFMKEYFNNKVEIARYFNSRPKKSQLKTMKTKAAVFNFGDKMYDLSPYNLEHIHFGRDYEDKVPKLPRGLRTLEFATFSLFNMKLDSKVLPESLETLEISYEFTRSLDLRCCPRLKKLILGAKWDHCLVDRLPNSIEHLEIHCRDYVHDLNPVLAQLPNLKVLIFGLYANYNSDLDFRHNPQYRKLKFGTQSEFNSRILNPPDTFSSLEIHGFERCDGYQFPQSLSELYIGGSFDHPFDDVTFPPQLRILSIDADEFNHSLVGRLPTTLNTLKIYGDKFNADVNPILTELSQLKHLTLGSGYTHVIDIPEGLVEIDIWNEGHPQHDLVLNRNNNVTTNKDTNNDADKYSLQAGSELEIEDDDCDDSLCLGVVYIGDEYGNKIGNLCSDTEEEDFE
jgi:hypothetical protein